jgi:hypothetical protein
MSAASTVSTRWARLPVHPKRALGWVAVALLVGMLAYASIARVLGKVGHPSPTLDDAYIHFQYARAIAEGHPFRYQAEAPISTGATSVLWPLLLAPFYALGARAEAILWPAWVLSYVALAALSMEAFSLTKPLAGRSAARGAALLVLAFGGFAWCAASGMEVVPFAWLLAHAARRGAEWAETPEARTPAALAKVAIVAALCPLMRPEGAIVTVALGLLVALYPRREASRLEAAWCFAGAVIPHALLFALTGSPTSSTAQVKLLQASPYAVLPDAFLENTRVLLGILDGSAWSAEFVPQGGAAFALLGLVAVAWRGHTTGRLARAGLVLTIALCMLAPCTYTTFLWNRLRYLWPFATGWLIGLACLTQILRELGSKIDARVGTWLSHVALGLFAGVLGSRLDFVLTDVAQSASGIDRQQATLGRWVAENLPKDAIVGVNDTGAVAYFGNRRTFDVVGLTTPGEGRYWVAGPASRFEHYERLQKTAPSSLPTHFVVYPEWMGIPSVLGRTLMLATVTDATILGGQSMHATEAEWSLLGTGASPWTALGETLDELDVADLESERAHDFELLGAREGEQSVREAPSPEGILLADGGRTRRKVDRFWVRLTGQAQRFAIARVAAGSPEETTSLRMRVAGQDVGRASLTNEAWTELSFPLPVTLRGEHVAVELVAEEGTFESFHYWFGGRATP